MGDGVMMPAAHPGTALHSRTDGVGPMAESSTARSSADVRLEVSPRDRRRGRELLARLCAAVLLLGAGLAVPMAPAAAADADATRTPASPRYTVSLTSDASASTWTGHESVSFS